jgi:type I restriction enzyme S subunit
LPLPPLSEQEKIADILSTLDEKIEIERKRREKLERIKKSLMDSLLTGKIRVRIEECDNDGRENK